MPDESTNFWRVQHEDPEFWDAYVSTRPVYSQSFYDKIFEHHAAHVSTWETAHDIGCGAGQLTAVLASRYKHVVASDCNDTHVAVAKRNLKSYGPDQISYMVSKGEDMAQRYPAHKADLVVCSEAMPIMNEGEAMRSFETLLRPGGTLALTFYGRPYFSEPEYHSLQSVLDETMDYYFRTMFQAGGPIPNPRLEVLRHVASGMASWLDYVDFDPAIWTDVVRNKWNPQACLPFYGENAIGVPVDTVSNIKPHERVNEVKDKTWWETTWSIADLKKYLDVLFPDFEEVVGHHDPEIERLLSVIEEGMGGSKASRTFTWPTVLVLATKK